MTIGSVPIDARSFTALDSSHVIETWLAKDWSNSGFVIPAGTHVTFDSEGHLRAADLARVTKINGLPLDHTTLFYPDGTPKGSTLAERTAIGQCDCAKGPVMFLPNQVLGSCILASNATVAGVRLRPGLFELSANGKLARGVLDQDLQLGASHFRPGDVLFYEFEDTATITILEAALVDDLEKEVTAQFDSLIPDGLVKMKEGQDMFGRYTGGDIAIQSATKSREPHAFVTTRKYAIRNFLKNPPVADCDCRVTLTAHLTWQLDASRKQFVADAGLKPHSIVWVETNFCPTALLGLGLVKFYDPFFGVPASQKEVVRQNFETE